MPSNAIAISMRKREQDWQTESDLESLLRAEQIKKDPKRFAAATKLAEKRVMENAAVASSDDAPAKK